MLRGSTVWDCSTFLKSIHWSAVGCDLFTAIHIFGNSPDDSRKVCISSGLDRGPRDCVCPLVLELRADLHFVTVFFMIGILVNVFLCIYSF